MNQNFKNPMLLLLAVVTTFGILGRQHLVSPDKSAAANATSKQTHPALLTAGDSDVDRAYSVRAHHIQVDGQGIAVKILKDDTEGSRHQKFLLRLPSGLTILIAHNIDLAPRVEGLQAGDNVQFNGDYEWSDKGGVVHWTHRDPSGRHVAGWLKHNGRTYQ